MVVVSGSFSYDFGMCFSTFLLIMFLQKTLLCIKTSQPPNTYKTTQTYKKTSFYLKDIDK